MSEERNTKTPVEYTRSLTGIGALIGNGGSQSGNTGMSQGSGTGSSQSGNTTNTGQGNGTSGGQSDLGGASKQGQ
jgi:hypothetical protein